MKQWATEAASRPAPETKQSAVWSIGENDRLEIRLQHPVRALVWHAHGDYLATVTSAADSSALLLHRVSQWRSQQPFARPKGTINGVLFHPRKPQLLLVLPRQVKIFDLSRQVLVKTLRSNGRQLSGVAMHRSGEFALREKNLLRSGFEPPIK